MLKRGWLLIKFEGGENFNCLCRERNKYVCNFEKGCFFLLKLKNEFRRSFFFSNLEGGDRGEHGGGGFILQLAL